MFFTFKLTSRRTLVITSAVIMLLLAIWFLGALLSESGAYCPTDEARIEWLLSNGITANEQPLWVREVTVGSGGGWNEYRERLQQQGFDISQYDGKQATVYCYIGTDEYEGRFVRIVSIAERAVAFDISDAA